jgi:hypothetical protein
VRIGGPQADTGGKVAVESGSLPAHDHAETYPAPAGRQRTNAPPTGTAAPRPNRRLARSEASRTPRILGDRHLGSNRGCGAVKDAIRSFDRIYRNCEDPPPGANTGVCSRAASREVWSALRRAMRHPTSPDHRPVRDGEATSLGIGWGHTQPRARAGLPCPRERGSRPSAPRRTSSSPEAQRFPAALCAGPIRRYQLPCSPRDARPSCVAATCSSRDVSRSGVSRASGFRVFSVGVARMGRGRW